MASVKDRGKFVEWNKKSEERSVDSRSRLARANEVFEHFNNSVAVPPSLVYTTEGGAPTAVTYGTGLGGEFVTTTDDVAGKSNSLNSQGLNWQANRQPEDQPLVFECRWKADTSTTAEYWFGITDALVDTDPIALSTTSTFTTSVPTDGVWMGYAATPSSGDAFTTGGNQHTSIAIKTNANTIVATGGGAFIINTYYTYRIEVDSTGAAVYFLDGQFHSKKAAALAANVPLGLVVAIVPRTTTSIIGTVDYIYLGGK